MALSSRLTRIAGLLIHVFLFLINLEYVSGRHSCFTPTFSSRRLHGNETTVDDDDDVIEEELKSTTVVLFMFLGLTVGILIMQFTSRFGGDVPYTCVVFLIGVLSSLISKNMAGLALLFPHFSLVKKRLIPLSSLSTFHPIQVPWANPSSNGLPLMQRCSCLSSSLLLSSVKP